MRAIFFGGEGWGRIGTGAMGTFLTEEFLAVLLENNFGTDFFSG